MVRRCGHRGGIGRRRPDHRPGRQRPALRAALDARPRCPRSRPRLQVPDRRHLPGAWLLAASVLEPGRFKMPGGPIEWRREELILGALLIVAVVRPRRRWWGGALAVFLRRARPVGGARAGTGARRDRRRHWVLPVLRAAAPIPCPRAAVPGAGPGAAASVDHGPPGRDYRNCLARRRRAGLSALRVPQPSDRSIVRDKEGLGLVNRVRLAGVSLACILFWYVAPEAIAARVAGRTGAGRASRGAPSPTPLAGPRCADPTQNAQSNAMGGTT
jgi:hypothetical protein